jgi:hypothetical protein
MIIIFYMPQTFDPNEVSKYIDKIYEAFTQHCEEIHQKTVEKIKQTADSDVQARKRLLDEQKVQLDKALAELKQVLNDITRKAREKMEMIENEQTSESFNLDKELANV